MSDQPKPVSQNPQVSALAMKFLVAAVIGGPLLGLAGLTLTGTMVGLAVAIPGLVLFSPILIPALIAVMLVTTGFVFSGGLLAASVAAMAWIYRYVSGKKLPWVGHLDYAGMKIGSKGGDVKEGAKENGEQKALETTTTGES